MSLEKKMEEKKKIKLIATDMDGTLVNDAKEVPASFAPWVLSHPDQQMVIASGRPYYTNEELFKEIKDHLIFIWRQWRLDLPAGASLGQGRHYSERSKILLGPL
jgi:hypothetical protein